MGSVESSRIHVFLILIVCIFAFFVNNQIIPADLMEARNLATAQEMVSYGNYLTPTLNGELRLEKPPLPTWIAAGIENITPDNLIVQRYAAGVMAALMVIFLYLLVIRLTQKKNLGFIAALVLATCFNIVMMGRTATWDIYCHSFMLGGIYFFVGGIQENGRQWFRFFLAGLFMGLSFLGKGPVSFYALLLPFLISYFIIIRPSLRKKILPILVMIVVCIAVSSWWAIYIMLFHKEMAVSVAGKESSSWLNHNVRPWYYYWQFPVEAGIWALFWITSLVWFYWKKRIEDRKAYLFSILWTIASLVLLSVIPEKKTRYLLPMLIPGAINIAFYIYYCASYRMNKGEKTLFRINSGIIAIILFALPFLLYFMFFQQGLISIGLFIATSVISILLGILLIKTISFKNSIPVMASFSIIVGVMIMVEALCLIPVGKTFINDERHSIKAVRNIERVEDLPFFHVQDEGLRMELVYESNRVIRPLDISDEQTVEQHLPFVLVSSTPADSLLNAEQVEIEKIDIYDNNWRKPTHKRHNKELVRHVSIISPKYEAE